MPSQKDLVTFGWTVITYSLSFLQCSEASGQSLIVELRPPHPRHYGAFGRSVSGVPDVTADGRADVVVGAPDSNTDYGSECIVFMSSTSNVYYILQSPTFVRSDFAFTLCGLGDLDQDGYGDIVVGGPTDPIPNGGLYGGIAYYYTGRTGALARSEAGFGGGFTSSITSVPDTNGDRIPDVLIGAPAAGTTANGIVFLFSGETGTVLHTFEPDPGTARAYFARFIAGVPDIDGDGFGDIVVSGPSEDVNGHRGAGRVYVFSGQSGTLLRSLYSPNPTPRGFGSGAAGLSDIDGDGFGDILLAARSETPPNGIRTQGAVYLFSGATGQLIRSIYAPNTRPDILFGWAVAGIPDFDGDGVMDYLISTHADSLPGQPSQSGVAYLYSGRSGALLRTLSSLHPVENGFFGDAVASVPDSNGDGLGDILIGAGAETLVPNGDITGRAYLFLSCRADWNGDWVFNSADFYAFITSFFSLNADFNHDGLTNSQDFFDYLAAFFAGCS